LHEGSVALDVQIQRNIKALVKLSVCNGSYIGNSVGSRYWLQPFGHPALVARWLISTSRHLEIKYLSKINQKPKMRILRFRDISQTHHHTVAGVAKMGFIVNNSYSYHRECQVTF
jgi:hypothetical protein